MAPFLLLPMFLACHWLTAADWDTWQQAHGIVDSGESGSQPQDTGVPTPDALCDQEWGRVNTTMEDQDERSLVIGSSMVLQFEVAGRGDVCELGCDQSWVDPIHLSNLYNYTEPDGWLEVPYRLQPEDLLYASYYFKPPSSLEPDTLATCWLRTTAGRYTTAVRAVSY